MRDLCLDYTPPQPALFHEPAHAAAAGAQLVIQRIVERQDSPRLRAEPGLHFRPKPALLILLLRFIAARVIDMHGPPGRGGAVGRAAVPHMAVHDYYVAGFSGYELLLRV